MGTNRKYWKGVEELKQTPEFLETIDKEFAQEMSVEEFLGDENLGDTSTNRRDFMKFLGFSVAQQLWLLAKLQLLKLYLMLISQRMLHLECLLFMLQLITMVIVTRV